MKSATVRQPGSQASRDAIRPQRQEARLAKRGTIYYETWAGSSQQSVRRGYHKSHRKIIVILMSVGSPRGRDEIIKYLKDIKSEHRITKSLILGVLKDPRNISTIIKAMRTPTADQVESLYNKYKKIGGASPLASITRRQAKRLCAVLKSSGIDARVTIAMKRPRPSISEAISEFKHYRNPLFIGIAMFPTYSKSFGDRYERMFTSGIKNSGIDADSIVVKSWDDNAKFRIAWSSKISKSYIPLRGKKTMVIFATHSIPKIFIDGGDPYIKNFESLARSVATMAGIRNWTCAYYTGGHPAPVPEITSQIRKCKEEGYKHILLVPLGYVADNFETLYGLGIMCKKAAAESRIRITQMHPLNDSPELSAALSDIVLNIVKNRTWRHS